MMTHFRFIGMLIVTCATVLGRSPDIAGALVNNIVARGIADEYVSAQQWNLGPSCGFVSKSVPVATMIALAEAAIRLEPTSHTAWLELGKARWARGQCYQALAAFEQSIELHGTLINPAQFQLARALYALGERKRSITIFRSIGGARYIAGLADHAHQGGDYRSALTLYALAIEIDPLPQIGEGFGVVAEQVTSLPKASSEDIWRELSLETPSDRSEHWRAVGELALLAGDTRAAKNAFLRGLALSRDPYFFYLALARVLVKSDDLDGAVVNYKLALNVKPTVSVMPYVKIAAIETTLGNYGEVVVWCDKARALFPDSHWPDFTQGYAAFGLGRLAEAETLFMSAHKKVPSDAYSLYYLGSINEAQNNFLGAARYFEQGASVNLVPSEKCAWLIKAGDMYQQGGEISKAEQMYVKGLMLCPSDPALYDRLRAIRMLQGP